MVQFRIRRRHRRVESSSARIDFQAFESELHVRIKQPHLDEARPIFPTLRG